MKMIYEIGTINNSDGKTMLRMWSVNVPAGKRPMQRHSHIQFEITYIAAGDGVYTTDSRQYKIQKGDVFVFSSNEFHYITDVGENGLKLINLHIEPTYLWGRQHDSLSEKNINLCYFHSNNFSNQIDISNSKNISKLILDIKTELEKQREEYPLFVKSLVNLILVSLIRDLNYSQAENQIDKTHIKGIRNAVSYIDSHLTEKITLETVAKFVGITPNYFSNLFHKFSNTPFQDYVIARRIELAEKMLSDETSNKSVLEIATLCGFNNTANFNKAFKKHTGITPREYRKFPNIPI